MTISIPRDVWDECEKQREVIPPGRHLLRISKVEYNDANDHFTVKYTTIAPVPGMAGEERFYLAEKTTGKFARKTAILFKRAGLAPRGEDIRNTVPVDPEQLTGTTWVVDVENATSEKGTIYSRWGPGFANFWPHDHEDVREFMASLQQRTRPTMGAQTAPAARAPAPTAAAVNGSADDF